MISVESGIVTDFSFSHFENAFSPIVLSSDGNMTLSTKQHSNAFSPMCLTESGIITRFLLPLYLTSISPSITNSFRGLSAKYFSSFYLDPGNEGLTPHFLWNAKMRFGKTFTAYQLALRMHWKHVLVLTFKPAVKTAWKEDLLTHKDFADWVFVEKQDNREFNHVDLTKRFVCFASFQDVLGTNSVGGIKATNEWIQTVHWDCIILDEYHFGAWGKNAKEFYNKQDVAAKIAQETADIYAEDAASKNTINSSPPILETISFERKFPRRIIDSAIIALSPDSCPKVSFIFLRPSISQ